jgi:phosphate transport system substrate-binding protein
VARDGIAVIVNRENSISELTVAQIGSIFSGAVTNWQELGGSNLPILVLSRESSSGTFVFFQEHVLNKADYTAHARFLPGTSAVVQAVSADRGAIGYVGLGFAVEGGEGIKSLRVKTEQDSPAIAPSEATVQAGTYAIARPLYYYTNGAATGLVKDFIDFCLGSEGQRIVRETGYVPVQ